MAQHNDKGNEGERLAQRHLLEHGYAILETNWHLGKNEVDIIAYKEGIIVFVEVKTRTSATFGNPQDFVTKEKQRAYIKMADHYILNNNRTEEARFDIIAIVWTDKGYNLEHIESAFSAMELYR